jgi:uncharacterized protein YbaR (Trm112 family)
MTKTEEATMAETAGGEIDTHLLELIVCPLTKGPLRYDKDAGELISAKAKLAYPVRDGIPILLVDESRALDDAPGSAS